eukprot:COSAG04_NODE_1653_length_6046_cov_6.955608_3_plen_61_part_00
MPPTGPLPAAAAAAAMVVAAQRRSMLERRVVRFAVASRLAVLTLCATFDAAVSPTHRPAG